MEHALRLSAARITFAASMMALGVLGFIYGDVALVWQHLPMAHLPGERWIAYLFAAIELGAGIGLLWPATRRPAAWTLCAFLLMWVVLLKLPGVVAMPQMEATWLGAGEIAVMLAGAWAWLATLPATSGQRGMMTGARGIKGARLLFALALPTLGLAHLFYGDQTAALVPSWLPHPLGWAYFTGVCSLVACVAVLLGTYAQLAARLEAAMLGIITVLVWGPAILATPSDRMPWTAFVISAAIASGAWLVAESYRYLPARNATWRAASPLVP